jgi:steroid delta-isomerase-like uncharacterized protein
MSEENKEIVRRLGSEGFAQGNEAVLDELLAEDYVDHGAPPGVEPGREGAKAFVKQLQAAFSDIEQSVDDLVAEGDKVAARWTFSANHTGEFIGVPASNKRITVTGIEIDRIEGGRVAEAWSQVDITAFLMQAGALEMPGG